MCDVSDVSVLLEKSWLMEQESLLQKEREKLESKAGQNTKIPSQEIVQFPQQAKKGDF